MSGLLEQLALLSKEKRNSILEDLVSYLVKSGNRAKLTRHLLSSNEWMEAKAYFLKTDRSYRDDVQATLGLFHDPVPPGEMSQVVSLATAQQVVGQRVNTYNDADLQTLAWLNQEDRALVSARLRTDPKQRFDGLLAVHTVMVSRGEPASQLLNDICELIKEITYLVDKAVALRMLAIHCAEIKDSREAALFHKAIQATLAINDILRGPSELRALALALIRFKYLEQAKQVSLAIESDVIQRDKALTALVEALSTAGNQDEVAAIKNLLSSPMRSSKPKTNEEQSSPEKGTTDQLQHTIDKALQDGLFEVALAAARSISMDGQRSRALGEISRGLAKAGDARAEAIFNEGREAAIVAENLPARITVLGKLIALLENVDCANQLFQMIVDLIEKIESPLRRASSLLVLAETLLTSGNSRAAALIDQVQNTLIERKSTGDWDAQLEHLMRLLVLSGRIDEVEAIIDHIFVDYNRANALTAAGHQLYEMNNSEQAIRILQKARQQTARIRPRDAGSIDTYEPAMALSHLAGVLTLAGEADADEYFDKALAAVDDLQDELDWSIAQAALIEALIKSGRYEDAEDLRSQLPIYEMESSIDSYQIEALIHDKRFEEAIERIADVQEEQFRRFSLSLIAEQMIRDDRLIQGLSILGPRSVDEFLSIIANYGWLGDQVFLGEMLLECVRIAAWTVPFWEQIWQLILKYR